MKKIIILGVLLLAVCQFAGAATQGTFKVYMTITEGNVAINVNDSFKSVNFGYVVKGSSVISVIGERTLTKNTGSVNVTYNLKIATSPTGWTPGTTINDTGVDKYVLATCYYVWDSTPAWSDYEDNDVLKTTDVACSSAAVGNFIPDTPSSPAAEDPNGANCDGYNIPPGEERSNFYFFNAPTSLTNTNQYSQEQNITIVITGVEQN